jgi:type IV pilus assembly protein PilC
MNAGYKRAREPEKKTGKKPAEKWNPLKRVSQEDLLLFTRQLRTMLDSGINLLYAFKSIAKQADNELFKTILARIQGNIESGFTLSRALSDHPAVFNQIYVGLIRTGEAFGNLPLALENLESFLEREVNIKKRISNASTYPIFALSISFLFAFFTFKFILPHFVAFFKDLNVALPIPTLIVIFLTNLLDQPLSIITFLLVVVVVGYLLKRYNMTDNGRLHIDSIKLDIPYAGPVARKIAIARLCNSLSALLEGGVELRRALELSGKASGNYVYEDNLKDAAKQLEQGNSLSGYFQGHKDLYGTIFPSMIKVGEESGDLSTMFKKISLMYEQDVENALASLTVLMEPLLIVFTGGIIGFIILAVFLPLYGLLNKLGG